MQDGLKFVVKGIKSTMPITSYRGIEWILMFFYRFPTSLAVISTLMSLACAAEPAPRSHDIKLSDNQVRAAGIDVQSIEAETAAGELAAPGVVIVPPQQLLVVAAPAAGLIEAFLVSNDEDVKAGDEIARLKSSDLVEGQRLFLAALSDSTLAAEKMRRDEQLFAERIIAERRLIVTRAEAAQAAFLLDERAQLLSLQGMSEADIAALRKTRRLASALVVRAPISGTIISRQGATGERVPTAAPLATIARLDPIWVNLQVPLSHAPALSKITDIRLPAFGLTGRLVRIGRSVDASTQSILVVAEFHPGKTPLRPGQAVQAILPIASSASGQWRVPAISVVANDGQSWIFIRNATGFRAQSVDVVAATPDHVTIRANISPGDKVAARGVLALLAELASSPAR